MSNHPTPSIPPAPFRVRPVYVASMGVISPLGPTWPQTLAAAVEGLSAIRPVSRFDVSGFPCQTAACVDDGWLQDNISEDRRWALAQVAALEACEGVWPLIEGVPPRRRGVMIGAESGRATFTTVLDFARAAGGGRTFQHELFGEQARAFADTFEAAAVSPATVASRLSAMIGAAGASQTMSLACSSSAAALVEGVRALRSGELDVVLCGGVGADVDPLMLAGFGLLGALSPTGRSCPFDVRRDGFVVGEGAAMFLLSSIPPESLGLRTLAQVIGVGRTLDAHHLVQPHPQGDGAVRAMRAALAEANLSSVDVIQAHGTSTKLNDAIEATALRAVFGDALSRSAVSSVKGALGHWVAGAGAIGFACAVEAVYSGTVLPTAGLCEPDADCALPLVMGRARCDQPVETALINAFAFGGANSTLIVASPHGLRPSHPTSP